MPSGPINLVLLGGTGSLVESSCDARPGMNELVLHVKRERCCELKISLRDGEAVVPFNHTLPISVEAEEGDGQSGSRVYDGRSVRIMLSRQGRYRVKIGPVPGYAPVETQRVDATEQQPAELVIALSRP
jgi:hypothetical protein